MSAGVVKYIPLNKGMKLSISGIPNDHFQINVGRSYDNIGLYYSVWFDQERPVITLRNKKNGHWINEKEITEFPFKLGQKFEVIIEFTQSEFLIQSAPGQNLNFPNSVGFLSYDHIWINGGVLVNGISLK